MCFSGFFWGGRGHIQPQPTQSIPILPSIHYHFSPLDITRCNPVYYKIPLPASRAGAIYTLLGRRRHASCTQAVTVVVASPTVTVSFWINVSVAVTVMKMEVVMPSTLVLVVSSPSPPLAATWLPLPMVVVAVVAGVGSWWVLDEVLVVWCLTGMTASGESESSDDEEVVGAWSSVAVVGVALTSTGDGVAVVFVEEEVVVVSALGAESKVIVVVDNSVVDDDDGWAFSVLVSSGSFVTEEESELDVVDGAFSSEVVVVEDELEGVSFSVAELVVVEEVTVSTPAFSPVADSDAVVSLGSIDEDDEDDVDVVASPEGVTVTYFVDEGTVIVTTPPPPPPVAETLCAVEDVVCWLEEVSVVVAAGGVTVTWTVEEGTVTVTTSPAPVALCSVVVEVEDELRVVGSCSSPEGVSLGVVEDVKVVGEKKPVTLLVVLSFAPLAPGVTAEPSVGVSEAEFPVDVVAVAPADWVVTVLLAGGWRAVPVGSLAVEVEEVCEDCVEATAEGVADCSVDSVANPDGPKELVAEESALACCNVEVKAEPVVLGPKVEDNWAEESSGVVEEVVEGEDWRVVLETVGAESPTEELVAVDGPLTGTTENGES